MQDGGQRAEGGAAGSRCAAGAGVPTPTEQDSDVKSDTDFMRRKPGKISRAVTVSAARGSQEREEVGQRPWKGWCRKVLTVPGPH